MLHQARQQRIVGWREWAGLPELNVKRIKAKLDTGAKTSTLHAFFVDPFHRGSATWVRFGVHPLQRNRRVERLCEARVADQRWITDSGGRREKRYIIETTLQIADICFPIELTLTNRDNLQFRMLLGRSALSHHFAVDPARSYVLGRPQKGRKTSSS
jgi:hypothetical protein